MGKIATKAFCNGLCSGAFSGDTTKCPTKSEIESVRIDVNGNGTDYAYLTVFQGTYADNQLVQEEDIKYVWPEYTFTVTPSESVTLDATGDSQQYTVTSYKIYYSNSSAGTKVKESQENVEYSSSKSGVGTWSSESNTITVSANNTNTRPSGTITFTQNDSETKITRTYTQKEGEQKWGTITINSFTVSDIPASGGCISSGTVTYTQNYGYGANDTGYTSTSGASVTYSTQVCGDNLDTTPTSRTRKGSLTVTVSRGGKTVTKTVDVYQQANVETDLGVFDSSNWSYYCTVSANPTTVDWRSGSTSRITSEGYRSKGTERRYSYTSGATRTEPIPGGEKENINVNLRITSGSSYASLSGSTNSGTLTFNENSSTSNDRDVVVYGELSGYTSYHDEVTVTQSEKSSTVPEYTLTCSRSSISFDESDSGSGDAQTFTVTSTARDRYVDGSGYAGSSYGVSWSLSKSGSDTSYFTVTPTSGSNGSTVRVYPTSQNYSSSYRGTMTIRVSNSGASDNVSVTQDGYTVYSTQYSISIDPTSYTFSKNGESRVAFEVTAQRRDGNSIDGWGSWTSTSWSVRECGLGTYSTSGNYVYVTVGKNEGGAISGKKLTVYCTGDSSETATATLGQEEGIVDISRGYQYEFSASPSSLSFTSSGGTKSVAVTSRRREIRETNSGYTPKSWTTWSNFSSSITSGTTYFSKSGTTSISVRASENTSTLSRSGNLRISQTREDVCNVSGYKSDTTPINVGLSQSGKVIPSIRVTGSIYWNTSSGSLLYFSPTLRFYIYDTMYIISDPGQGGTQQIDYAKIPNEGSSNWEVVIDFSGFDDDVVETLKTGNYSGSGDINIGSLTFTYND